MRQLVYDLRSWTRIEALGRAGGDEGADILAIESTGHDTSYTEDLENPPPVRSRTWVFQCKREKTIGPSKIRTYVRQSLSERTDVHAFVIAAPCDFSLKTRTAFRDEARRFGVAEAHLWGKAELEDRLFLPELDHLLFAYFGVSLQIRRKSRRAELTQRITMKRKLLKHIPFDGSGFDLILLRDPSAVKYPYIDDFAAFVRQPHWMYFECVGHRPPDHLRFIVFERPGWYNAATGEWDIPRLGEKFPLAHRLYGAPDEWSTGPDEQPQIAHVPSENRAIIRIYRELSYDRILAVDEIGDSANRGTHLLVEWSDETSFFDPGALVQALDESLHHRAWLDVDKQTDYFKSAARTAG